MATTTDTSKFVVDTTQALPALTKLTGGLEKVQKVFGGLQGKLAAIGFGALAKSAVAAADEISDLSDATGIAIGKLVEFKKAMDLSGGSGTELVKSVSTFSQSVEEAVQGSLKAQNTFAQLGVSISDLNNMSMSDLMNKTLQGIAKLESQSERTGKMMDLFGKSMRSVSAESFIGELQRLDGSGQQYAASIKKAAELNDKLSEAFSNLKLAMLVSFEPVINKLSAFVDALMKSKATLELVGASIKLIGVLIATKLAGSALLGIVTMIGTLGRGVGALMTMFGSPAAGKFLAVMFQATGQAAKLLPALRAIALILSAGMGVFAATQLFDNFGDVASNAVARIIELMGELSGMLAGGALGASLGSILGPIGTIVGGLAGAFAGDKLADLLGVKSLVNKAKEAREETEKLAQAQKNLAAGGTSEPDTPKRNTDLTAINNARRAIQEMGNAYADANEKIRQQIDVESELIGKTKLQSDQLKAQADLAQRTKEEIDKLTDAKAKMSKEERDAGMGAEYDKQIERVKELGQAEQARLNAAISRQNQLQAIEQLRQFGINQEIQLNQQLRSLQNEAANVFLPEIEKKYNDLSLAAKEAAESAIAAEEARIGRPLNTDERLAYYEKATDGLQRLTEATKKLNDEQNKFQLHLFTIQQQISLTNNLQAIQDDMAKSTMSEIEKKYYDIAAAARDSAKAAVEAEEQRRNAKLDPSEVQAYYDAAYAGVSRLTEATRKQWELSRQFSTGWQQAWQEYTDNATNAAAQARTIFNSMSNAFESMFEQMVRNGKVNWQSLLQDMTIALMKSDIQRLFSSITGGVGGGSGGLFGSIGKMFSGAFANGGTIPVGGYGIVGESGPEIVNGPATVTPMAAPTQVTYQINAVDAKSFQQLLAQQPDLIHGLAEKGRKNAGGR